MKEIYISTDIESDGPIPGEYSMLSLASVAFDEKGKILGEFYKKLKPLPKAKQHPETMAFWKQNPKAYKEATSNQEDPKKAIKEYSNWLKQFRSKDKEPFFLGWPATFDFMFTYWYLHKFTDEYDKKFFNEITLPFSGIDVRSYAMGMLKRPFLKTGQKKLPKSFFKNTGKHTHKAIDDARYQGKIFINMLKENKK